MLSYRLNCRTNTENKNQSVEKTNNDEPMLLSKCEVCDSKKSRLIKEEEASRLLSSLGMNLLLPKVSN